MTTTGTLNVQQVTAALKARSTPGPEKASWGGVFAMSLCVFALIASEFMPVSLLTPIAEELGITEGMAGHGIAISGVFAVITSLSISALARTMNRKTLLLAMTVLMALSGVLVALAPNVLVYMLGRVLIGIVVGGFWSMSAATAIRLVPAHQVPKALAIFNGGNALAAVLAAPIGSYLGSIVGWRGAFFALVPIAVIALVWQAISLPSMPVGERAAGAGNVFTALRDRTVAIGMVACGLFFMGQFVLFTYVRPFLETVTHVDAASLSLVLLMVGAAGLIGTTVIGRFIARSLSATIAVIPALMALIAVALIPFGPSLVAVLVLFGLWGFLSTAAPVGWWSWIARVLPDRAEAGGGLMVAVIQSSIALGATAGGLLFDAAGHVLTFGVSAGILMLGAVLAALTGRSHRAHTLR